MKSPSLNHYANLRYNCKIKKAPCEKLLLDLDGGKIKTTDLLKGTILKKESFYCRITILGHVLFSIVKNKFNMYNKQY